MVSSDGQEPKKEEAQNNLQHFSSWMEVKFAPSRLTHPDFVTWESLIASLSKSSCLPKL
jgi:hypothetical protein